MSIEQITRSSIKHKSHFIDSIRQMSHYKNDGLNDKPNGLNDHQNELIIKELFTYCLTTSSDNFYRLQQLLDNIWNMKNQTINYKENIMDSRLFCLRFIAYYRDPQEGLGNRNGGRLAWIWLQMSHEEVFKHNFEWFVTEGCRLDDLLYLWNDFGLQRIAQQLEIDQNIIVVTIYNTCKHLQEVKKTFLPNDKLTKLLTKSLSEIQSNKGDLDRFLQYSMEQLTEQKCTYRGRPISLMAKWAPTPGCQLDRKNGVVAKLIKIMSITERQYRRLFLTPLRKYLDILETHMCAKDWDNIDLQKIPQRALKKSMNTLEKHLSPEKQNELLNIFNQKFNQQNDQSENESEKISPIIKARKLIKHYLQYPWMDQQIEQEWKEFLIYIDNEHGNSFGKNSIVVLDTSGSMADKSLDLAILLTLLSTHVTKDDHKYKIFNEKTDKKVSPTVSNIGFDISSDEEEKKDYQENQIINTNNTITTDDFESLPPLELDNQLNEKKEDSDMIDDDLIDDISLMEIKDGKSIFNHKVINFSDQPKLFRIDNDLSLFDQIQILLKMKWHEKLSVFDTLILLLIMAKKSGLKKMIDKLYVLTDHQVDNIDIDIYNILKIEYAGYEIPQIIYWNINDQNTIICPSKQFNNKIVYLQNYDYPTIEIIIELGITDPTDLIYEIHMQRIFNNQSRYNSLKIPDNIKNTNVDTIKNIIKKNHKKPVRSKIVRSNRLSSVLSSVPPMNN